ncbi:NRPS [Arthroderma sp. PD_2]|nr:NRPS [Arthroderma sp. PD_2]
MLEQIQPKVEEAVAHPDLSDRINTRSSDADKATIESSSQRQNQPPENLFMDGNVLSAEDISNIWKWNRKLPTSVNSCLHDLIHQMCLRQPDAPAVSAWDGDFSYSVLDSLSSALANHLSAHNAQPNTIIPLLFNKSRWTTVSILGILKSSAAFVLLDASHPQERLKEICMAINSPIIIASAANSSRAGQLAPLVVSVEDENSECFCTDIPQSVNAVMPTDTAYAVFTSGSTGKPKGVLIPHNAACSTVTAYTRVMDLDFQSRVLQFSSYAFDASVFDQLSTLIVGGCLCVPSDTDRLSGISQAVDKFRVNAALLTPSVTRTLVPEEIPTLKSLTLGGEEMTAADIEQWSSHVRLSNAYGPAECACVSTTQPLVRGTTCPGNIGYGIASVTWLVDKDDHTKLVPIGEVGELLIEGPSVGRGYLNNPAAGSGYVDSPLWLQRFRPTSGGCKVYKTGDIGYYTPDGSIRLIGRKDAQVKIHGQRVELGEIEYHLRNQFPDAQGVLVDFSTTSEANQVSALIGYVCITQNEAAWGGNDSNQPLFLNLSELFRTQALDAEAEMCKHLPSYMIPSIIIPLSYLPLSLSGKADRRRLKDEVSKLTRVELWAYAIKASSSTERKMPSTALEKQLQELWSITLKIPLEELGVEDNFFNIGGNSIDTMALANLGRQRGIKHLLAPVIFKHPTISALAKALETHAGEEEEGGTSIQVMLPTDSILQEIRTTYQSIEVNNIVEILPTTQIQEINHGYSSRYLIELHPSVSIPRLEAAWQAVVRSHAILRTVFIRHESHLLQVVLRDIDVKISQVECEEDPYKYAEEMCREASLAPVPLGIPHLYLKLVSGQERRVLILGLSTCDGTSLKPLCATLAAAYNDPNEVTRAPPVSDYPDYMRFRLGQKRSRAFRFWKDYLAGSKMLTPVDNELPGPEAIPMEFKQIPIPTCVPGFTLATMVLAAWAITFSQNTGSKDLVLGYVSSGRDIPLPGIENVVGACVTSIPVRLILQPTWTYNDLLRHVKEQRILTMPYETLDLRDIVSQSTDWPVGTQFGGVMVHEDVDYYPKIYLGGKLCPSTALNLMTTKQLYMFSSIVYGSLFVCILPCQGVVSQGLAAELVGKMCDTLEEIQRAPEKLIFENQG